MVFAALASMQGFLSHVEPSERPTQGTVCGTMRSMCGADAGCLTINYQSLGMVTPDIDGISNYRNIVWDVQFSGFGFRVLGFGFRVSGFGFE